MNEKQKLVLHGLLELSDSEAVDVVTEFVDLRRQLATDQMSRKREIERTVKMYTGPISGSGGGCPCCGG